MYMHTPHIRHEIVRLRSNVSAVRTSLGTGFGRTRARRVNEATIGVHTRRLKEDGEALVPELIVNGKQLIAARRTRPPPKANFSGD